MLDKVKEKVETSLASMYIKYWLLPNIEDLTNPGFVITKLTGGESDAVLRDLFVPEELFMEIENAFDEKHGVTGRTALYSAGKKAGYVYASLSSLTRRSSTSDEKFLKFLGQLVIFIGGTYSSKVSYVVDLEKKTFELSFDNFVVCKENGRGYIITEGSIAGVWAYMIGDKSVEGLQLECKGRCGAKCSVVIQPRDRFDKSVSVYNVGNLPEIKYDEEFMEYNHVQPTSHSKNSLKSLIDGKFFEYRDCMVLFKGVRHFEMDPYFIYLIEEETSVLESGKETLFEAAFKTGKSIIKVANDRSLNFITDYLSALGWGDVLVEESRGVFTFSSTYHPWTKYSLKSEYTIIRGLVSGMLSEQRQKEIRLGPAKIDLEQGWLQISAKATEARI